MSGLRREYARIAMSCGWNVKSLLRLNELMEECQFTVYNEDDFLMPWGIRVEGCFMVYRSFSVVDMERAFAWDLNVKEPVVAYTDGSGTTGDKPAGIGVYLLVPGKPPEYIPENIGKGTNNRAELVAIWRALRAVPDCSQSMLIRSDSEYAIGSCVNRSWEPKVNIDLISRMRQDLDCRKDVKFEHVDGHSKIAGNEVADLLSKIGRKWISTVSEYEG